MHFSIVSKKVVSDRETESKHEVNLADVEIIYVESSKKYIKKKWRVVSDITLTEDDWNSIFDIQTKKFRKTIYNEFFKNHLSLALNVECNLVPNQSYVSKKRMNTYTILYRCSRAGCKATYKLKAQESLTSIVYQNGSVAH